MNVQPIQLSRTEARQFLLRSHYLLGAKLRGRRQAIKAVLGRLRAIQVDSIDAAGTNQDLVLQSRVAHYRPEHLRRLLYQERGAYEYWLKSLCILPVESFPFYRNQMQQAETWLAPFLSEHGDTVEAVLDAIRRHGPRAPGDFSDPRQCDGGWYGSQRVVKRALEVLWETGRLMIHHRNGRQRYYDLAERCLPGVEPARESGEFRRRAMMDVYSAMRLFSPRGGSSQVWHIVRGFRHAVHMELEKSGEIVPVEVEGSRRRYFILNEDLPILDSLRVGKARVRLLAPLDSMLWDRRMIKEVFDFDYTFEVYKKPEERQFGYYSLPILYGTELVGRCDLGRKKGEPCLTVRSVHWEEGVTPSPELIGEFALALRDHIRFLGLERITLPRASFAGRKALSPLLP